MLDFLYGRHTFVNAAAGPALRHAGAAPGSDWVRVDDAGRYQRGGLLPMAVFLTKNAPGLRTSPVKRGYWVVRRVLGEQIPPPPAQVPELPSDERKLGDLTLREMLAKHRENAACAGCHARFDSFGLAFEGYGPVGERAHRRPGRPAGGHPASPSAGDGQRGRRASTGLRDHLRAHRQDDFLDNLCRKLLSYAPGPRAAAVGRDRPSQQMRARLAAERPSLRRPGREHRAAARSS